jgi:hypothetical protein
MIGARWYSLLGLQQDYISASLLEGSGLVAWHNGSHPVRFQRPRVDADLVAFGSFRSCHFLIRQPNTPGVISFISQRVRETGACKFRHMESFTQKYPAWRVILVTFYF